MDTNETIFDVVKRACRTNETPDANWHPQVQSRPTQTSVGSLERVEEYARRVERGEEIWNEQDPTCFARAGEGRPEVYRFAGSQVRTIREDY